MSDQINRLARADSGLKLAYVGMETDLIFTQGIDLPGFASYTLLATEAGRMRLRGYYERLLALGASHDVGVILESPTWVANKSRGAALGHSEDQLAQFNKDAIAQMREVRDAANQRDVILSANIGPRDDAYAPEAQMTAQEAHLYHNRQIAVLAETDVDVISGYTLANPAEAIGIVRAARDHALPVVISFTVETDGNLPTGISLAEAISQVDDATDHYAAYFMINCAHPAHFADILTDAAWVQRLGGVIANASRCSHAELDEATTLDAGDPAELGRDLAKIAARLPHIRVWGGCCGTDMRHMDEIAKAETGRHPA